MRQPDAYPSLIDFSKNTFENFILPDWMAQLYGLPTSKTVDGEVVHITYTPKQAYDLNGVRYIPYIDNGEGIAVTRLDQDNSPLTLEGDAPIEPTDYLAPAVEGGGLIARVIDNLAMAAGTTMEACLLGNAQGKTLLRTGVRPTPQT